MSKPKLCVRDLDVVLALARAGSTVRAASALHVTQSAVSRGLLLAEQKLGVRLFERQARGLVPTPAGQRLVDGAGPVLAALADLEARAVAPEGAPLELRIACECYTAYRWLPSALASLRQQFSRQPWPGRQRLELQLMPDHTASPVAALADGELDEALLTTSSVRAPLVEKPLFSDEIVFLLAASHPLAARPALTRRQLREHPLITSTQTPKPEQRWFLNAAFGRSVPRLEFLRFPLTEAIVDAARAGMGIAVMSEWIASGYLPSPDLVVKRLDGKPLLRPWRIAFRRESSEGAAVLARALESAPPRVHARPGLAFHET
ncbi:MAG TPA: LysR family transcriptional regulator [Polyangiaceae bacterium]|nr:LysR family transcriptional regulator [Polyangiaceae bacterium]